MSWQTLQVLYQYCKDLSEIGCRAHKLRNIDLRILTWGAIDGRDMSDSMMNWDRFKSGIVVRIRM